MPTPYMGGSVIHPYLGSERRPCIPCIPTRPEKTLIALGLCQIHPPQGECITEPRCTPILGFGLSSINGLSAFLGSKGCCDGVQLGS